MQEPVMLQIEKIKVEELVKFLEEQPYRISNPIINFLQANLKPVEKCAECKCEE
jgi:hypothetical protein